MSTWITIQTSDLYDYLCAPQLNVLRNFGQSDDQTNPINEIIDDITARIRAEISGNKRNLLSADKTKIPQDLKSFACYLILESAQTRIPSLKLSVDQVRLASDAKEYLKRIAQGEVPVSIPDEATTVNDFTAGGRCEVVHRRPHHVSGKTLGGF
jgi:phage gp36-like protein